MHTQSANNRNKIHVIHTNNFTLPEIESATENQSISYCSNRAANDEF